MLQINRGKLLCIGIVIFLVVSVSSGCIGYFAIEHKLPGKYDLIEKRCMSNAFKFSTACYDFNDPAGNWK